MSMCGAPLRALAAVLPVVIALSACGSEGDGSSSPPTSSSSAAPSSSARPSTTAPTTSAAPALATPDRFVQLCTVSPNGLLINTVDLDTGAVTGSTTPTRPGPTATGGPEWEPTENGSSAFCKNQAYQWSTHYDSLTGTLTRPDGTQVPATLPFGGATPTALTAWPAAGGSFSAPEPAEVLTVAYVPATATAGDEQLIWVRSVPGDESRVSVQRSGGAPTTVQLPVGTYVASVGFQPDGSPYLIARSNSGGSSDDIVGLDGSVIDRDPDEDDNRITNVEMQRLLPQTQYSVGDGVLSADRSTICFLATSPTGELTAFTVGSGGGEPTEVVDSVVLPFSGPVVGSVMVGCQP